MTVLSRKILMAGLLAASVFTTPAFAGFQWTAPAAATNVPASAPAAPVAQAPVAPVASESLPQSIGEVAAVAPAAPAYSADDPITWNTPYNQQAKQAPRAPQNVVPFMQQQAAPAVAAPMAIAPAQTAQPQAQAQAQTQAQAVAATQMMPVIGAQIPAAVAAAPSSGGFQMAEGFGSDLPLVMAIRQIVPSQYGFVFDEGIDLSGQVSWQGGKPWDQVLQETLNPLGLRANISGNVVSIMRSGAATPVVQAAGVQAAGAVMTTDTVSTNMQTPMTAMPVSMVATPANVIPANIIPANVAAATAPAAGSMAVPVASGGADLVTSTTWTAARNSTLRTILEDWAGRAGVEVYWSSEYDYPIQSGVTIQGTFEQAVQKLLKGLSESKPRPLARLHPNLPDGPAVLVVETRQSTM